MVHTWDMCKPQRLKTSDWRAQQKPCAHKQMLAEQCISQGIQAPLQGAHTPYKAWEGVLKKLSSSTLSSQGKDTRIGEGCLMVKTSILLTISSFLFLCRHWKANYCQNCEDLIMCITSSAGCTAGAFLFEICVPQSENAFNETLHCIYLPDLVFVTDLSSRPANMKGEEWVKWTKVERPTQ